MIQLFRKTKLHTRLIATVLAISAIPLILLTCLSYGIFRASIQNKLIQSTCQSAQIAGSNVNLILRNYRHYIDVISVSDAVQGLGGIESQAARYNTTYQISLLIQATPIPDSGLMGVMIVDQNKKPVYGTGYATATTQEMLELLERCDKTSPKDCLDKFVNSNFSTDFIAVARKIYSLKLGGTHIGYIVVLLSAESLYTSTFASPKIQDDAGFLLISSSGQVIASQEPEGFSLDAMEQALVSDLMAQSRAAENYTASCVKNSYLHICYYNQTSDSFMLSVIPYSFISNEQRRVFIIMLLFLIPLILLCLAVCYLLNRSINLPIRNMIESCRADINSDDYHPIGDDSPDELGFLARTLDTKNQNIIELIDDIRESDARKRDLELEILHYQINPHFLFNTLGTFKWMAELSNNTILGDGIGSLISLLKSTLVENSEFVTLRNEIENLKHYNRIQDLRYISRFHTRYALEEAALDCLIPHFILQPLLENAILYATADIDRIVNIVITAGLDRGTLTITVSDDGAGFDVSSNYDSKNERFTGIGLQNVNERLQLYYGAKSRLVIDSKIGVGTTCTLRIPAVYEMKNRGNPHVHNSTG